MNYILSQFNFWDLARYFNNREHTFYYKNAPKYILDWMRKNGIRVVKSEERPENATLVHGSYADWPAESELRDDIPIRKYYIDDENYNIVIQSIKGNDRLIYNENLTKQLSDALRERATFYPIGSGAGDAPKERIILDHVTVQTNSSLNEVPESYEIVHYIGNVVNSVEYRRHKLNKYLKQHYNVATIYRGFCSLEGIKCLIVSDPRSSGQLVSEAIRLNIPIYYDRTDNWNAIYPEIEDFVIENAKAVFCSSRYLYETTNHPNKIRLDNAGDEWNYSNPQKYPTAVYIGKALNKQDQEFCNKLREEHPDYKFVAIGAKIDGFEHLPLLPKDVMMSYIERASIGLVPIKNEEYYKGQFNLKVWDYINAHLPVLVTNDYNYKDVKNVHTEWTTEFVEEEVPHWDSVFDRINKEIKNESV